MSYATPVTAASIKPVDRLFGLVELMSQHAAARLDGYESARITAAIVGHLRALVDAMPNAPQVRNDAEVWLDHWETIAQQQRGLQAVAARQSLFSLLANYSEARL
jgi:hypothetical protein